jgi:hypothetical protein
MPRPVLPGGAQPDPFWPLTREAPGFHVHQWGGGIAGLLMRQLPRGFLSAL